MRFTGSTRALSLLDDWDTTRGKFVKVFPNEYKRALSELHDRMPVEQALAAIEECGAPMVSIAGGEPLMHPQIDVIVAELIKRKKFVFLCTNALLLPKKLDKFKPSPYFAWVVHIDGLRERHDESVCKDGVFDEAVAAIKESTTPR